MNGNSRTYEGIEEERLAFEEFAFLVKNQIREHLSEKFQSAEVHCEYVNKAGGGYVGMTVRPKDCLGVPIVNLDAYYALYRQNGEFDKILESIAGMLEYWTRDLNTQQMDRYEDVKDRLFLRLVNTERNEAYLRDMPLRRVAADLALTCHVRVDLVKDEIYSSPILNEMLEEYGVSEEQLFQDAFASAMAMFPPRFESMEHTLMKWKTDIMGEPIPGEPSADSAPGVLVLTNPYMMQGAAALFYPGVMEEASRRLQGDFYVIPSSVHELLLLPAEHSRSWLELERIVWKVNRTQVAPEELLSDHVYYYDASTQHFDQASAFEKNRPKPAELQAMLDWIDTVDTEIL